MSAVRHARHILRSWLNSAVNEIHTRYHLHRWASENARQDRKLSIKSVATDDGFLVDQVAVTALHLKAGRVAFGWQVATYDAVLKLQNWECTMPN